LTINAIAAELREKYFADASAKDVTVISKNIGHVWYSHNPKYPEQGS
jgi:hypothetical protein